MITSQYFFSTSQKKKKKKKLLSAQTSRAWNFKTLTFAPSRHKQVRPRHVTRMCAMAGQGGEGEWEGEGMRSGRGRGDLKSLVSLAG